MIAACQKAAWWALRAGDPEAIVCQNCFATHKARLAEDFAENEPWAYFDTLNFHHYSGTDAYPGYYGAMRRISGGRPLWVTEAGTHVNWEGDEKEQEPSWESQQRQARFVLQCFAASLSEGSSATFYFLLPHYVEGRVQFGLTHKDLTPRPSYLALAAAGRLLAGAKPLGRLKAEGPLRAFAFRALPEGTEAIVLVAWAQAGEAALPLPAELKAQAAFDFLGRPIAPGGSVGIDPVYLLYPPGAEKQLALLPPPEPAAWTEAKPCPLVLQALLPTDRIRLDASAYALSREEKLDVLVYAYNFGEAPVAAEVTASADRSLEVSPASVPVELKPMDRAELHFRLSAREGQPGGSNCPLRLAAECGEQGRAVAVIRFTVPAGPVAPGASLPVKSAQDPANWRKLVSPGTMTLGPAEGGGILVDAAMEPGDRWVYPILAPPPDELPAADWDGLAFTIVPLAGRGDFKAIFDERGGSSYYGVADLGKEPEQGKPCRAVVLFRECEWGAWSKDDPGGRLDRGQIATLKIGCNTKDPHVRFIVRDVAWVKLK